MSVNKVILLGRVGKDPEFFKSEISKATGKPVEIARAGLEIELTNKPY